MNVLVCDDDRKIVDSIIEELKKKSEEMHVSSRFYGFSQPSQIDLSLPYDIALLDIDMGETNGIELAKKLRAENENIVIIFITNFIQYAPEGFEVQAFRYLLKSDLSAKLDSYFDSAVQEVLRQKQLVTISINSEIIDVPANDILYLESHRRIIVMHLLDEKRPAYQFYGNITELSEKIEPLGFLRIQKSYLVNMQAAQIQYVNSVIMGMAQYLQTSICAHAYHAIDRRVNNAALAVWKKLYPKRYNSMQVPLKVLCNLPDRHKGYDSKTFAVWVEGNWFGITYAFITHSHYESKPFDQKMTPYTAEGRRRYVSYRTKHKPLPCDRPSVNSPSDIAISAYAKGRMNFEYYMNREYAYSRDKGKCKCCGNAFSPMLQKHCHHVKNKLPLDRINKVPNLVWLCEPCHRMVHNSPIPPELNAKTVGKIMKYREKLKM